MKVALLISGYLRTLETNIDNIKQMILDKFDSIDVYIHITQNESNDDKYLNPQDITESIRFINDMLSPTVLLCEDNQKFTSENLTNNLINSWIKFYKLNTIKKLNEEIHGKYDLVIRTRPDVILDTVDFDGDGHIVIPIDSKIDKSKLIHEDDSYICDIFCYGSSELMDKYFDIFNHIPDIVSDVGNVPETVLFHYLNKYNIPYKLCDIKYDVILSKCNVFAIAGDSGSGKTTLGNFLKKYFSNSFLLECDRYHKWERGNINWQTYTHLNPDANYITKMNDDIFNLKIKNDVYQVDYDHTTGKFREPKKLDNSDNIIVCGLHSLYGPTEHIYNMTVFMDTDERLKTDWKIQRDSEVRGYDEEVVREQISKRKPDYQKYIEPQKKISDVIVNFNGDSVDNMNLFLYIKRKYQLDYILDKLNKHRIPYTHMTTSKYNILRFDDYVDSELWVSGVDDEFNFYKYVLFILINLK